MAYDITIRAKRVAVPPDEVVVDVVVVVKDPPFEFPRIDDERVAFPVADRFTLI